MGQAYDEVIALKRSRNEEQQHKHLLKLDDAVREEADESVVVHANGGVLSGNAGVTSILVNGGASSSLTLHGGELDLTCGFLISLLIWMPLNHLFLFWTLLLFPILL